MSIASNVAHVALVGIGATLVLDAWLLALQLLGVPTSNFALVGRWVAGMPRGRYTHAAISKARPERFELGIGWLTHYAVGIVFAAVFVALNGAGWLAQPTWWPAFAFGIATVVVPLFVMQPAMGAGFAASKTPAPLANCARSAANHAVFGFGLYVAALGIAAVLP